MNSMIGLFIQIEGNIIYKLLKDSVILNCYYKINHEFDHVLFTLYFNTKIQLKLDKLQTII